MMHYHLFSAVHTGEKRLLRFAGEPEQAAQDVVQHMDTLHLTDKDTKDHLEDTNKHIKNMDKSVKDRKETATQALDGLDGKLRKGMDVTMSKTNAFIQQRIKDFTPDQREAFKAALVSKLNAKYAADMQAMMQQLPEHLRRSGVATNVFSFSGDTLVFDVSGGAGDKAGADGADKNTKRPGSVPDQNLKPADGAPEVDNRPPPKTEGERLGRSLEDKMKQLKDPNNKDNKITLLLETVGICLEMLSNLKDLNKAPKVDQNGKPVDAKTDTKNTPSEGQRLDKAGLKALKDKAKEKGHPNLEAYAKVRTKEKEKAETDVKSAKEELATAEKGVPTKEEELKKIQAKKPEERTDADKGRLQNLPEEIGALKGKIEGIQRRLAEAEARLKEIDTEVTQLKNAKDDADGMAKKINGSLDEMRRSIMDVKDKKLVAKPGMELLAEIFKSQVVRNDDYDVSLKMDDAARVTLQKTVRDMGIPSQDADMGWDASGNISNPDNFLKTIKAMLEKTVNPQKAAPGEKKEGAGSAKTSETAPRAPTVNPEVMETSLKGMYTSLEDALHTYGTDGLKNAQKILDSMNSLNPTKDVADKVLADKKSIEFYEDSSYHKVSFDQTQSKFTLAYDGTETLSKLTANTDYHVKNINESLAKNESVDRTLRQLTRMLTMLQQREPVAVQKFVEQVQTATIKDAKGAEKKLTVDLAQKKVVLS